MYLHIVHINKFVFIICICIYTDNVFCFFYIYYIYYIVICIHLHIYMHMVFNDDSKLFSVARSPNSRIFGKNFSRGSPGFERRTVPQQRAGLSSESGVNIHKNVEHSWFSYENYFAFFWVLKIHIWIYRMV